MVQQNQLLGQLLKVQSTMLMLLSVPEAERPKVMDEAISGDGSN